MSLFGPLFVPDALREAVSDSAWLTAMLDVERALASAEALAGVIPAAAATEIAGRCRAELFDLDEILGRARAVGNPAEPLVRALRELLGPDAALHVHRGATSQDVLDSAAMLVSARALDLILAELDGVADACAVLARAHVATPMAGRTLLQQAVPITFGLKAAGWLAAVVEARARLRELRSSGLAAQLGGAAGTLAVLGDAGPEVLRLFAIELELAEPPLPWHTNRLRVAALGAALDQAAGALAKVALDVALLAQTEVAEVAERAGGGSSTMPHKRNPIGSALAIACSRLVHGNSAVLAASLVQEHERGVGGWQAEWPALSDALAYTGGAASALLGVLEGLEVDEARMRANLDASHGLVVAERVSYALAEQLGRSEAHELVDGAAGRAATSGRSFRDELLGDERMPLPAEELDALLDAETYLGSAATFVERALALHDREETT